MSGRERRLLQKYQQRQNQEQVDVVLENFASTDYDNR